MLWVGLWYVLVAFPGLRQAHYARSTCKYQVMYDIKSLSSCVLKNDLKICGLEDLLWPKVQVTLFTKCKSIWLHYSPFHTQTFYNFCQFLITYKKFPPYCPVPKLLKLVFSTEKRDPNVKRNPGLCSWADLEEGGQGVWTPAGKSQVAIDFLRNTGTDPLGANCLSGSAVAQW